MKEFFVYQYNSDGHCNGTSNKHMPDSAEPVPLDNEFIVSSPIKMLVTRSIPQADGTIIKDSYQAYVDANWTFTLDENGKPAFDSDENYIVTPPVYTVSPPGTDEYNFLGLLNGGFLKLDMISPDKIRLINYAFASIGLPPLPGTSHIDIPTFTAAPIPQQG